MGAGETLAVCVDCWNSSVYARRAARKSQLADHWKQFRNEQATEMLAAGASIGDRVSYFAPSMLGAAFGGLLITGQIVANRNGVAVVKLDRQHDGKTQTAWNKGWKHAR